VQEQNDDPDRKKPNQFNTGPGWIIVAIVFFTIMNFLMSKDCPQSGPGKSPLRAIWVWWSDNKDDTMWPILPSDKATFWTKNVLDDPLPYLAFAKQEGIIRTWLAIRTSKFLSTDIKIVSGDKNSGLFTKKLQAFCYLASLQCMEVELLFGNDENLKPEEYTDRATICLNIIDELKKNFPNSPGIVGIQADIEYHNRRYKEGHPDAGMKIWEALSDSESAKKKFKDYVQANKDALALRDDLIDTVTDLVEMCGKKSVPVAMVAWWNYAQSEKWPGHMVDGIVLSRKLMDLGIDIALMAYRGAFGPVTAFGSALYWSSQWLSQAKAAVTSNPKLKTKVWLGLETKCSFPDVSYCGTAEQQKNGDLTKASQLNPDLITLDALGKSTAPSQYAGVAVHDGAEYPVLVMKLAKKVSP